MEQGYLHAGPTGRLLCEDDPWRHRVRDGGAGDDEEDRCPWLHAIAAETGRRHVSGISVAVARSALKRSYRDILIGARPDVVLVYLQGDKQLIARRPALRRDHLRPPALLDSQFQTLQEPTPGEHPIVASMGNAPEAIADGSSRI